jgi:DNA-binding XRE family transcriptional regulator
MEQKDKVAAAGLTAGSAKAPSPASQAARDSAEPSPRDAGPSEAVDRAEGRAAAPANELPSGTSPGGDFGDDRPSSDADERQLERSNSGRGKGSGKAAPEPNGPRRANNVRRIRIEHMMSKAELARRANLSVLTIDRVERGYGCRMDTKRKILEALGLSLAERVRVFGEEE